MSHGLADIYSILDRDQDHRITMHEYARIYDSRDGEPQMTRPPRREQTYHAPPIYSTEPHAGGPDMAYAPGEDDHHMAEQSSGHRESNPSHHQQAHPEIRDPVHGAHHITASMWPEVDATVTLR